MRRRHTLRKKVPATFSAKHLFPSPAPAPAAASTLPAPESRPDGQSPAPAAAGRVFHCGRPHQRRRARFFPDPSPRQRAPWNSPRPGSRRARRELRVARGGATADPAGHRLPRNSFRRSIRSRRTVADGRHLSHPTGAAVRQPARPGWRIAQLHRPRAASTAARGLRRRRRSRGRGNLRPPSHRSDSTPRPSPAPPARDCSTPPPRSRRRHRRSARPSDETRRASRAGFLVPRAERARSPSKGAPKKGAGTSLRLRASHLFRQRDRSSRGAAAGPLGT